LFRIVRELVFICTFHSLKQPIRVTVAVSTEIGTILLHDPEGVMRAYSLDNLQEVEIGDHAMASIAGLPFPVSFVPGSPLAILGATGM
jgi:hypothetical protein